MPPLALHLDKNNNNALAKKRSSVDSFSSNDSSVRLRNRWRPSSLVNLLNPSRRSSGAILESTSSSIECDDDTRSHLDFITTTIEKASSRWGTLMREKSVCDTLVTVVLVEAKGLPDVPNDGSSHGLYCKIRLGSQLFKSKTVDSHSPQWRERFQFSNVYNDDSLKVTLWDKGKQKNFMGNGVLDLSQLERDRTHEVWLQLDDNYGSIHFSVTICNTHKTEVIPEESTVEPSINKHNELFSFGEDWHIVGELHVKVVAAKGLGGKQVAYCTLEVDNEKVRTHTTAPSQEPTWNQNFIFKVYDVTSTLDLKVYESSIVTALRNDSVGRVAIPLLRVNNGEKRWYALKDKSKRSSARGNCPRVLLEMSLYWNPIKASLRLFRPKEVKYIKKSQKFDIALVYKNIEFVRDTFVLLEDLNESFKQLFEWDNREYSMMVLCCWLIFWYHFKLWTTPLLMLVPFAYFWINNRNNQEKSFMRGYGVTEQDKPDRKLTSRIQEIPEMTLTITDNIDYMASLSEKFYNLASFKVPFLSYLTMTLLVMASIGFYIIPFNYIMMGFGIYKFSRKFLQPDRVLNNDLADFISRIPDTEILNDWRELNVPEPTPQLTRNKLKEQDTAQG